MEFSYQQKLSGKSVGIVFGSFSPLHQGHLDVIMRAKKENDGGCLLIVCGEENDKGGTLMPHSKRYRYVREFFNDDEFVAVYAINDTELEVPSYPNGWNKWLVEVERLWDLSVVSPKNTKRVWYVGDPEYQEELTKRGQTAVLLNRQDNLISSTMIRNNPIKNWDAITYPFRRLFSTNILITGTASEGKTTLVKDLGKYFNAPYSYEWARNYMEESCVSGWELDGADFIAFLEGQYNLNKSLINSRANHGIFFADTDSLVTKMYAKQYAEDSRFVLTEEEYKSIETTADALCKKSRWDKVFLLPPHNVFVDDHSRYMGHSDDNSRQQLFFKLLQELHKADLKDKITILDGNYYENFCKVVSYVKGIIDNGKN